MRATVNIWSSILFPLWFLCFPFTGNAQEIIEDIETKTDTITVETPDSLTQAVLIAADSAIVVVDSTLAPELVVSTKAFKPNSTRAILYSIIPGMGQIYNRQYWKLPLVYGGFMGFLYAVTWNNKNYQDYWNGYKTMLEDATAYNELVQNTPEGVEVDYTFNEAWINIITGVTQENAKEHVNNTGQQQTLKSRKDSFRRYRDLSIILTVGFYFITMVDAYIDAELFDFDISPDLSMRVEPMVSPQTRITPRTLGLNCTITF